MEEEKMELEMNSETTAVRNPPDNEAEVSMTDPFFDNDTSQFGSGKLCNTLREAPMIFPYEKDKFYIRECYPQYYDLLMQRFKDKERNYHCITVTGTPGIGKSIFYLYFLMRYRRENPEKSVVTASFTIKQKLKKCVIFQRDGKIIPQLGLDDQPKLPSPDNPVWKELNCEFYLYDGPPEYNPDGVKTISFSSPHVDWLNSMRKNGHHLAIYMPSWTLEELQHANERLGLNIEKAELEDRFKTFGGSARYCLTTDKTFLNTGHTAIKKAFNELKDFSQVETLFEGDQESSKTIHRLMNYIPDEEDQSAFSLKPASLWITDQLRHLLLRKLWDGRRKLMSTLEGSTAGSVFAGWLFESFAHDTLAAGGSFPIRSLQNHSVMVDVAIQVDRSAVLRAEMTRGEIFADVYYVPQARNYPSIDSFVLTDEGHLLLFQITRSASHSIKASGLIRTMTRLGMLDKIEANPLLAAIIFVVPNTTSAGFNRQKIVGVDTRSWEDVQALDVDVVPGIGSATKQKLEMAGIKTIAELLVALHSNPNLLSPAVKKSAEEFFHPLSLQYLTRIPQFVLGLESRHIIETARTRTARTTRTAQFSCLLCFARR